jgi:hypothetical protein
MTITDYLEEAAKALRLPEELRQVMHTISYDPGDQEWFSSNHEYEDSAIRVEIFSWALRLIGWLQYKYPQGPPFPEVSWG